MNNTSMRTAALTVGDLAVLVVVRPAWRGTLSGLAHPRAWLERGPDVAVAQGCGVLLWLAAAWIAFALVAGVGARLPGVAGRLCARCARVLVPRLLLRIVLGTTGLGLLAAPAAQALTPTGAAPTGPQVRVTAAWVHPAAARSWVDAGIPSPSWPVGPSPSTTTLPPPTPPTPPVTAPTPTSPTPAPPTSTPRTSSTQQPTTERVRPGDSLWLLAAHRLGPLAADGDIARYWPQIYAANRAVVGGDPSVIRPGQVLGLPAPTSFTNQETP